LFCWGRRVGQEKGVDFGGERKNNPPPPPREVGSNIEEAFQHRAYSGT